MEEHEDFDIKSGDRWPVESYATEINHIDNFLSDDPNFKGWKFLWDGKTSAGWRGAKLKTFLKGWIVKDGALKVISLYLREVGKLEGVVIL